MGVDENGADPRPRHRLSNGNSAHGEYCRESKAGSATPRSKNRSKHPSLGKLRLQTGEEKLQRGLNEHFIHTFS